MDFRGKRILIVDDEEDLCEILQYNLINEGFIAEVAHSAEEALKMNLSGFDLLILDMMLGEMSGLKFAVRLKNELENPAPFIFLTAKDSENDILTGFSIGADDYITKPFSVNELIARVKALLRRMNAKLVDNPPPSKSGNFELDINRKRLVINNEYVELTKKEFEILRLLIENPNRVFSREEILGRVWGYDVVVSDRTIDVNITRIRAKLGKFAENLKNKTGYGYFFEF